MRAGIYDLATMGTKATSWRQFLSQDAWRAFQRFDLPSKFVNASSDFFDGNLGSAFHLAPDSTLFKSLDGLGKALESSEWGSTG